MSQNLHLNELLLNAWSAESLLGVVDGDTSDLDKSRDYLLQWTIPQAYYSTWYMVRALLMARGKRTTTTPEADLFQIVDNLIDGGYYDYNQTWRDSEGRNFLRLLSTTRNHQTCKSSFEELQGFQRNAVKQIDLIHGWHERKIAEIVGMDEYAKMLLTIPDSLRTAPLAPRWLAMMDSVTF